MPIHRRGFFRPRGRGSVEAVPGLLRPILRSSCAQGDFDYRASKFDVSSVMVVCGTYITYNNQAITAMVSPKTLAN